MTRASYIQNQLEQINTVQDLTEVFESVASIHISKIRNQVISSKEFFAELWPIYRSLRIDPKERIANTKRVKGRDTFIALTTQGKLGGEIDESIVEDLLIEHSKKPHAEIMSIGDRGTKILANHGLTVNKTFDLPQGDSNFNVAEIINALAEYDHITVFYQTYESLRTQKVVRIELLNAVRELGEGIGEDAETVSSQDYIFEPSIVEIADYMESVMMSVALTQIIMESKLAGYAARFNSMSRAKTKAKELLGDLRLHYYRTKRSESDERIKETIKTVKIKQRSAEGVL